MDPMNNGEYRVATIEGEMSAAASVTSSGVSTSASVAAKELRTVEAFIVEESMELSKANATATISPERTKLYKSVISLVALILSISVVASSGAGLALVYLSNPSNKLFRGDRDSLHDSFVLSIAVSGIETIIYTCIFFLCSLKHIDKISVGSATGLSIIASVVTYCVLVAGLVQSGNYNREDISCSGFGCADTMAAVSSGLLGVRAIFLAVGADCFVCRDSFRAPENEREKCTKCCCWELVEDDK